MTFSGDPFPDSRIAICKACETVTFSERCGKCGGENAACGKCGRCPSCDGPL